MISGNIRGAKTTGKSNKRLIDLEIVSSAYRKLRGLTREGSAAETELSRTYVSESIAPRLTYNFTADALFHTAGALGARQGLVKRRTADCAEKTEQRRPSCSDDQQRLRRGSAFRINEAQKQKSVKGAKRKNGR